MSKVIGKIKSFLVDIWEGIDALFYFAKAFLFPDCESAIIHDIMMN